MTRSRTTRPHTAQPALDGAAPDERVHLALTRDEALVLFAWLAERSDDGSVPGDPALERVLWDVEAALEPQLDAVVAPDYDDRLAAARARLAGPPSGE